jgi:hypothetical protein
LNFFQQPIEKKLSRLLGGQVTFEGLKVSPFAGRVEAGGMRVVQASGTDPVLCVRRISAEVSVAKALTGEIQIKSMSIEGAVINLVRAVDGGLNLPRKSEALEGPKGSGGANVLSAPAGSEPAGADKGIKFEAQVMRLNGAQVTFMNRANGYQVVASGIDGEIRELGGRVDFSFSIGAIRRADVLVELGSVKVRGMINGPLANVSRAGGNVAVELSDGMKGTVTSTRFAEKSAAVEFGGAVDLAKFLGMLPSGVVLPDAVVTALEKNGGSEVSGKVEVDGKGGVLIQELKFAIRNVRI